MTGGVDKTFCILGGKRIVTGRGPGAAAAAADDDDSSKRSSY